MAVCPYSNKECEHFCSKDDKAIPYEEILKHLNETTKKKYRNTNANRILIRARWKEGFRIDDFKAVHNNMAGQWLYNPEFNQYLRPVTLYSASRFEGYLNHKSENGDAPITAKDAETHEAWCKFTQEKDRALSTGEVKFSDPKTIKAIFALGGWAKVKFMNNDELHDSFKLAYGGGRVQEQDRMKMVAGDID